jgi:hypothetical protein
MEDRKQRAGRHGRLGPKDELFSPYVGGMVNVRSPSLVWQNADFKLEIAPLKPFYFVSEAPDVWLLVTNRADVVFDQRVTVVWRLSGGMVGQVTVNGEVVRVQLGPHEAKRIPLRGQWLPFPGFADYGINFPTVPGMNGQGVESGHEDPVASYSVFDQGPFEREEGWRRRAENLQERTFYGFLVSVAGTLILTGLVIYLTFKPNL